MKLTKQQRKHHERALELVHHYEPGKHRNAYMDCPCGNKETGCDECDDGRINVLQYIYSNLLPAGLRCDPGATGAFFTPYRDALQVAWSGGARGRILEPSAGIGVIADAVRRFNFGTHGSGFAPGTTVVCVELVTEYYEIGKRLVPDAEWINGNIFDVLPTLGRFDCVVGNPPFGKVPSNRSKNFGNDIAFGILDAVLPQLKHGGTVILPAGSHGYESQHSDINSGNKRDYQKLRKLHPQWVMTPSSFMVSNQWHGANIKCEICEIEPDSRYQPEPKPEPEEAPKPWRDRMKARATQLLNA